ncbi:hypothetical protein ACQP1P_19530 [Dactylosporangium sp. CA-052675]|uniref:hypothetical protein n=1 Tax=Dactylosporangium sp. CA-052675 TaxID=3239927 RepID=UPI003D8FD9F7
MRSRDHDERSGLSAAGSGPSTGAPRTPSPAKPLPSGMKADDLELVESTGSVVLHDTCVPFTRVVPKYSKSSIKCGTEPALRDPVWLVWFDSKARADDYLNQDVDVNVEGNSSGSCQSGKSRSGSWSGGRYTCFEYNNGYAITWTIESRSVYASVADDSPTALYAWWTDHRTLS